MTGPPHPPPSGPHGSGTPRDPGAKLRLIRNLLIGLISLVTVAALAATCSVDNGFGSRSARDYIQATYTRNAALDEGSATTGYVANGDVTSVARDISNAQRPTDIRPGAKKFGNVEGAQFLQYPDYIVGLFPYGADKTRVMLSSDYRTGYNHYHGYIGSYWVPIPHYSGRGNTYRGGGSGSGK